MVLGLIGLAELLVLALIIGAIFLMRIAPKGGFRFGRLAVKIVKEISSIKKYFR